MTDNREGATSTNTLWQRARAGDSRALERVFRRLGEALSRWTRGRIPRWARRLNETADLVQDALLQTFVRMDRIENRGKGAIAAYLRKAVLNRVLDESRRVVNRRTNDLGDDLFQHAAPGPSPFDVAVDAESEQIYKDALRSLTEEERLLVVGRLECDYTYEQLALLTKRPTAGAARVAVRRATEKLARIMGSDGVA